MAKPKLPPNPADQTSMGRVRAGANIKSKKALRNAANKIYTQALELEYSAIETVNAADTAERYIYELDPMRAANINNWLQNVFYFELLGNEQGIWAQDWYLNMYFDAAIERGTVKQLDDAQRIATVQAVGDDESQIMRSIKIASVLDDPAFVRRVRGVYARAFNEMKGLSDSCKATISSELAKGMALGKSPRVIAKTLRKKTLEQEYRLLRISRTEINRSYTDAYMSEQKDLNERVYAESPHVMQLMHLSALADNTRINHAKRHGTVTTKEKQEDWWSEGANRINCQCSVTTVLVDRKTGKPIDDDFVQEVKDQRKEWK